jgi:Zn-dependent protease with chaperone function
VRPSRILKLYYLVTFVIGVFMTVPVAQLVQSHELGGRGAAIMILCWNTLFVMLLPMVLDWGERRYFKARFLQIEEVAKTNPELAAVISEQCQKLALPGLRFAIIDSASDELFSYGLWRTNPRLVITGDLLREERRTSIIPSVEAELARFATQDHTLVFILFAIVQVIFQQLIIAFLH